METPTSSVTSSADAPEHGVEGPAIKQNPQVDVVAFRKTDEGKSLVAWATSEFNRCKNARTRVQTQWNVNMAMLFGRQWITAGAQNSAVAGRIVDQQMPKYRKPKTVNRLRSYARTEHSKFLSTFPNIVAVPATAEDQDVRAAYAAEQAWASYSATKRFRHQYSAAVWWMILAGVGFMKTWWDPNVKVATKDDGEDYGDIAFRKVSPFNMFVPESRESEIDDQPYVIEAYTRPLSWAKKTYAAVLKDVKLEASTSEMSFIEAASRASVATDVGKLDSVTVFEFWLKPGAYDKAPEGAYFIMIDDILVAYYEGMPYAHGEFPYTKIGHMYNDTFWDDSPLVDLIPLQREYNELRTDIATAARRMGRPQLLAARGSIIASKLTNEPGSVIEYQPGLPEPKPMTLTSIPQYVVEQQDRVLTDIEDISGQHEVSKGQAPTGVTAGTALTYLGERDDNYLTPQFQNIEDAFERIARQTLQLFQQYVDIERKIKVIGLDGAYDTMLLQSADIKNGTDVRAEPGSAVGQSQAAKQAQVMDLVNLNIIGGDQALKLMEIGGPQKVLDIVNAAERKAQRENMKLKGLTDAEIQVSQAQSLQELKGQVAQAVQSGALDPQMAEMALSQAGSMLPCVVPVDDFDVHEVHIEVHNRFRMSQEYETLSPAVKAEFEKHVADHQQMGGAIMQSQLMAQMPPEVAAQDQQGADPATMQVAGGTPTPPDAPAPAM